jgi:hypothetical protein
MMLGNAPNMSLHLFFRIDSPANRVPANVVESMVRPGVLTPRLARALAAPAGCSLTLSAGLCATDQPATRGFDNDGPIRFVPISQRFRSVACG